MSQRHLKMMLRSPSFNEINADLQYYRDNKEVKIDLKVGGGRALFSKTCSRHAFILIAPDVFSLFNCRRHDGQISR